MLFLIWPEQLSSHYACDHLVSRQENVNSVRKYGLYIRYLLDEVLRSFVVDRHLTSSFYPQYVICHSLFEVHQLPER